MKRSTIIMSISQISETLFHFGYSILFEKYGIKKVMLISMLAWVIASDFLHTEIQPPD
jgi:NHS family xanthosine MFS transporter